MRGNLTADDVMRDLIPNFSSQVAQVSSVKLACKLGKKKCMNPGIVRSSLGHLHLVEINQSWFWICNGVVSQMLQMPSRTRVHFFVFQLNYEQFNSVLHFSVLRKMNVLHLQWLYLPFLEPSAHVPGRNTQSLAPSRAPSPPGARTKCHVRSFLHSAVATWNGLPAAIIAAFMPSRRSRTNSSLSRRLLP